MTAKEYIQKQGYTEIDEGFLHGAEGGEWIDEDILIGLMEGYHEEKIKPSLYDWQCSVCSTKLLEFKDGRVFCKKCLAIYQDPNKQL